MRWLAKESKVEYERLETFEKTVLTRRIVWYIQQQGGRFLERDESGLWKIMKDNDARLKVSAAIQDVKIDEEDPLDAALEVHLDEDAVLIMFRALGISHTCD